jgi:transposase
MTQAERDQLVVLKKTKKGLMTQKEAAAELQVTERQIRRMVWRLKTVGDKSVIHGLKGKVSNSKLDEEVRKRTLEVLSDKRCHDFGPTYARDHLAAKHGIQVSKETMRHWMIEDKRWRAGRKKAERKVHVWRERRSRFGDLVQWDTSTHDWLEGRGSEPIYLITMIDDATSRVLARFVPHDSTEENMKLLETYLQRFGRPRAFYTDKATLFQTAEKTKRGESRQERDPKEMPPTQIGRALGELGIIWIAAHSPQAKGRVERSFQTDQDRLVKDLRMAGAATLEQANQCLETEFLPWWQKNLTLDPRDAEDAHRPLEKGHDLAAILSDVESRIVKTDYTFQFEGNKYVVERADIRTGLRGAAVRIEKRRDGTLAVRFERHYLRYRSCDSGAVTEAPVPRLPSKPAKKTAPKSAWMKKFDFKKSPSLGKAIVISNATS